MLVINALRLHGFAKGFVCLHELLVCLPIVILGCVEKAVGLLSMLNTHHMLSVLPIVSKRPLEPQHENS